MIKLQVIGNLGKDCVTNTVNGKNVINFNVAHTEKFKDGSGQQKEKTTWVECAYWTERTGIAPYLKKGTQVYVEGSQDFHQKRWYRGCVFDNESAECAVAGWRTKIRTWFYERWNHLQ